MAKIQTFQKLKKRFDREILIKSLAFGLSFGVFLTGLLLLVFKLCQVELALLYYIIIDVGSSALAVGVLFLLLRRGDKAFARKLDEDLSLPEKVQTMVAFRLEDGDMVEMQRADAEETLRNAPKGKTVFQRFWASILAGVIALVTLVSGAVIPKKTTPPIVTPPPVETPFDITAWQINALTELVADVRGSKMQDDAKTTSVTALENLLAALPNVALQKDMKTIVVATIVTVDGAMESVNTYKKICVALYNESESEGLKAFAQSISVLNGSGYREKFVKLQEDHFTGDAILTEIQLFTTEAAEKLADVQVVETDPLLVSVKAFANTLAEAGVEIETGAYGEEKTQETLAEVFTSGAETVGEPLLQQYENKATRDHVKTRLMEIFDLTAADLPKLAGDAEPRLADDDGADDNGSQGSGGYGEGEDLYAGNDVIYDPYGQESGYKSYGDAWEETYYQKISQLVIEGNLDPELIEYINDYFLKLSPESNGN